MHLPSDEAVAVKKGGPSVVVKEGDREVARRPEGGDRVHLPSAPGAPPEAGLTIKVRPLGLGEVVEAQELWTLQIAY